MNIEQRMDPDLWEIYKQFPLIEVDLGDIAAARKAMSEMIAHSSAGRPRSQRVGVHNLDIPGPAGAPNVPIRIYTPTIARRNSPALLWIHGGGFTLGDLDQDDALCERLVDEGGCLVVSVKYRLAPEHPFPAGPEDCYSALCWLANSAAELGVDPDLLAVGGESAGGGIAAGVAIMARDRREVKLAFQLLLCPCIDDRHTTQSSREVTDERNWSRNKSINGWKAYLGAAWQGQISPYAAPARLSDCAGLAPAYLMVGELELMRDEIIDYAGRLLRAGVATELHVWPGAFHGFEVLVPNATISRSAVADYLDALERAWISRSKRKI